MNFTKNMIIIYCSSKNVAPEAAAGVVLKSVTPQIIDSNLYTTGHHVSLTATKKCIFTRVSMRFHDNSYKNTGRDH